MDQTGPDNIGAPASQPLAAAPSSFTRSNFGLAIVGGIGAALFGAALWAVVAVITQMELGVMAIAVGFLVGYAIRNLGRGEDIKFGILGAVCALIGCVLGNILGAVAFFAQAKALPFFQVLTGATPDFLERLATVTFQPMDLLFYGIAIYEGFKFSVNRGRA